MITRRWTRRNETESPAILAFHMLGRQAGPFAPSARYTFTACISTFSVFCHAFLLDWWYTCISRTVFATSSFMDRNDWYQLKYMVKDNRCDRIMQSKYLKWELNVSKTIIEIWNILLSRVTIFKSNRMKEYYAISVCTGIGVESKHLFYYIKIVR
jgi:hypothetical protein